MTYVFTRMVTYEIKHMGKDMYLIQVREKCARAIFNLVVFCYILLLYRIAYCGYASTNLITLPHMEPGTVGTLQ